MHDDITNSHNGQHYILHHTIINRPLWLADISNLELAAVGTNTIFTRQQLLLIALYKTSPMFYKHQQSTFNTHSTPWVLINNSFVSELESQFNHRKVTFKRNKDVRVGFDMLCEIGRQDVGQSITPSLTTQNISNAIKRNVCNTSVSGGHYLRLLVIVESP